jgi:hypothetical protein
MNAPTPIGFWNLGMALMQCFFERYGCQRDVWGIDDCQVLSYFTADPVEWKRRFNGFHP